MLGRLAAYADLALKMRPSQTAGRVRRAVPPAWLLAGVEAPRTVPFRPLAAGTAIDDAPQSGPLPSPHVEGAFHFLGRHRRFADEPGFWEPGDDGLLFAFLLHEFGELARTASEPANEQARAFWSAVLDSWLRRCSTPAAAAWHPFPLSGRLMAWCAALSTPSLTLEPHLADRLRSSMWLQLRYLRRAVEHDVGGNHVIRNGCALAIAGACLDDERARQAGERILRREVRRQVLADGGHEERSPSYHRVVLRDLTDAAEVSRRAGRPLAEVDAAIAAMRGWTEELAGPDGALPRFGDAWDGPPVADRRSAGLSVLRGSGFVVLRHDDDQAVLQVGELAPAHLPAHAHAHALSFVLWLDGRPVVVDPGAFTYAGPERDAFRGTAAHATLEVDGRDQCRFWGPFRASFLPRVRLDDVAHVGDVTVVRASHDGYRRLGDPVVHHRCFAWLPGDGLVVVDRIAAGVAHTVTSRLPLDPSVDPDAPSPASIVAIGAGPAPTVVGGHVAPYLGRQVGAPVLARGLRLVPGDRTGWALLRPGASAELRGAGLRVTRRDGSTVDLAV